MRDAIISITSAAIGAAAGAWVAAYFAPSQQINVYPAIDLGEVVEEAEITYRGKQAVPEIDLRGTDTQVDCQPQALEQPPVSAAGDQEQSKTTQRTDYVIDIKTSNRKYAKTGEIILLSLNGTLGAITNLRLDNPKRNDFERGNIDRFTIENGIELGEIKKVRLEIKDNDKDGKINGWFPEYILITNKEQKKTWRFELNEWLDDKEGRELFLERSSPDLG